MPLLYHPKESVTKVSFAMNGVSLIPLKHAEQPKSFLYSKNYHTLLKNKSMMIPTNFKEQPPKSAPEKQKPPIMSVCITFPHQQLNSISSYIVNSGAERGSLGFSVANPLKALKSNLYHCIGMFFSLPFRCSAACSSRI